MTAYEAYWKSRVVFIGKAVDIKPVTEASNQYLTDTSTTDGLQFIMIHFKVQKRYRGKPSADVEVQAHVNNSGTSGSRFKQGERYLVYAYTRLKDYDSPIIEDCSRTNLVALAGEDLEYIAGLPKMDSDVIEADGEFRPISMPQHPFPEEARRAGITGAVFVRLIVNEAGKVITAQAMCGTKAN